MNKYDFSGWATRNNLLCGDGRTIRKDAFKDCDGVTVPLVYGHDHDNVDAILGHALLENRDEGIYAYCSLNDTESGQATKKIVAHGDVASLSIYANNLKQDSKRNVVHGVIRELSLVLAGANPGAYIDTVMAHSEEDSEELMESLEACYDENIMLYHSDEPKEEEKETEMKENQKEKPADTEETVEDVFNTLSEKQKTAVYAILGEALHGDESDIDDEEDEDVKHNLFENEQDNEDVLMHSAIVADAIADAKRYGSMKESFVEHAASEGITNLDYLFPDATELNTPPKFIKNDETWVSKIMGAMKHTPFSRVKTTFATLDENEARARGYIKGNMKKEMALALLRRITTPTTVYIKMKIDRDDVIDIADFDVVAWQKNEMRGQLDKELATAALLGDGRSISSEDKINEQNIRPIISDDDMYTIKYTVTSGVDYKSTANSASGNDSLTKGVIRAAVKSRKNYKGSGNPTFFTTEDMLTEMLLIEDQNGRSIYDSIEKLATAMRVKEIITIPEMERYDKIYGIIVNMNDYTAGADKGGSVNLFDDFDIDYNQMKYLMETRMSGALTTPYSAIVLKKEVA